LWQQVLKQSLLQTLTLKPQLLLVTGSEEASEYKIGLCSNQNTGLAANVTSRRDRNVGGSSTLINQASCYGQHA
jgi:hypothetical protein